MGLRLLEMGLAACVLAGLLGPAQAQNQPLPAFSPGQRITILGAVERAGLHRVLFAGDDGRKYRLDTSHASTTMEGGGQPALTPGTRIYVSGRLVSAGDIAVSRLQVIPAAMPVTPAAPESADPLDYTVRGTVEAIDYERGSFALRIKTHTRIVFVTADTDVSGLGLVAVGRFPVQPGRRVTVGGSLQPDGTVLAGLLTAKGDVDFRAAPTQANRVLIGTVSSTANKLVRRDIKVRLADGTETKIQVPRSIPIRRSGRQISVYDLSGRDAVRITGRSSGADLRAFRIEVLAPVPSVVPANETSASPARPGL